MTQQHGLVWGALDFVSETPTEAGYVVAAMADGTGFGNPAPIVEVIQSLLTDGALAVTQRWDNREVTMAVRLSAPTATAGPALAAAEAALMAEVLADQPSPLVYTPPADGSAVTVFDVVNARLDRDSGDDWDIDEVQQEHRFYTLTLTCLPFARSEDLTTATALPLPPTPGGAPVVTTVDTCGSITNWSRETNGGSPSGPTAVTVSGQTAVAASAKISSASDYLRLIRTGAISVPTGQYLRVDAQVVHGGYTWLGKWQIHAMVGTTAHVVNPTSIIAAGGEAGSDRLFFSAASLPSGITALKVLFDFKTPVQGFGATTETLRVFNLSYTDTLGDTTTSTARQQARIITVAGSAPTTAALRVYDSTPAALGGNILVHTSSNVDWQPPLRRWRSSSSAVTADTSLVSGGRHTLTANTVYRVPANLLTEGTYALMARLDVTTSATLSWSARMVTSAGATTVGSSVTQTGSITAPVTSGYDVMALGALTLPIVNVEGTQLVELTLTGTANMTLDEAWLFGLDDGVLTWVRDVFDAALAPLGQMSWTEIRSPELGAARPSVWGGQAADRSDGACVDYKCESFGTHQFDPGQMQVFTVTTTTLKSQSEIEFYPRYHSHVLDESA